MFRLIRLKQLNSLALVDFISLGGRAITLQTAVRNVKVRFPAKARGFVFAFLFCCCVLTLYPNTLFTFAPFLLQL